MRSAARFLWLCPLLGIFGDKLDSGRVWYLAMDEPASDILLVWPRADDLGRSYA